MLAFRNVPIMRKSLVGYEAHAVGLQGCIDGATQTHADLVVVPSTLRCHDLDMACQGLEVFDQDKARPRVGGPMQGVTLCARLLGPGQGPLEAF